MSEHPILTVSQLSNAIKHCLESSFPIVWLQGEISNCKPHSSGHLYFSLKDANAQISAIMFRADALQLPIPPKDGMQVIVCGEINVYPSSGKYQIVIRQMRPVGRGELLLKLEELKIKLHKQGWFRKERKRPLPKFPKTIGVVTSPTGAAIQDMLNILTRRSGGFHLILNPVKVQGDGAAQEIAQAIEQFNRYNLVDVMIVGRGGGSIEDLWAFNEEIVAAAIYNSRIPIICAVGHETDNCIAEYVADVRAPTPSAAAEIVIAEKTHQIKHLTETRKRIQHSILHLIRQDKQRLQSILKQPLLRTPYGILGPTIQRLDDIREHLDGAIKQHLSTNSLKILNKRSLLLSLRPSEKLKHFQQKLFSLDRDIRNTILRKIQLARQLMHRGSANLQSTWKLSLQNKHSRLQPLVKYRQLNSLWSRHWQNKNERLKGLIEALHAVNPKNVLTKGYCILFSEKDHCAITTVRSIQKNQNVQVLLSDGELSATINHIVPK